MAMEHLPLPFIDDIAIKSSFLRGFQLRRLSSGGVNLLHGPRQVCWRMGLWSSTRPRVFAQSRWFGHSGKISWERQLAWHHPQTTRFPHRESAEDAFFRGSCDNAGFGISFFLVPICSLTCSIYELY